MADSHILSVLPYLTMISKDSNAFRLSIIERIQNRRVHNGNGEERYSMAITRLHRTTWWIRRYHSYFRLLTTVIHDSGISYDINYSHNIAGVSGTND